MAVDILGGQGALVETEQGNKFILVMIDVFTKYLVAVALPNQLARSIARAILENWILVFGAPHRLLSDQGVNFESSVISNLCAIWRIDKVRTTSYHPAGNGVCERANQTIKKGLAKTLNEKNLEEWDIVLANVVFAYNTSVHRSTGFSPYFLMFGVEARVPSEILIGLPPLEDSPSSFAFQRYLELGPVYEAVRENLSVMQKHAKDLYDLGANARIFIPGDKVRVRLKSIPKSGSKLLAKWSDLYEVINVRGVVISLRDPKNQNVLYVHADRLSNVNRHLREEPNDEFSNDTTFVRADLDKLDKPSSSLEFLGNERAIGKRRIKPAQDSDYEYNLTTLYTFIAIMSDPNEFLNDPSRLGQAQQNLQLQLGAQAGQNPATQTSGLGSTVNTVLIPQTPGLGQAQFQGIPMDLTGQMRPPRSQSIPPNIPGGALYAAQRAQSLSRYTTHISRRFAQQGM